MTKNTKPSRMRRAIAALALTTAFAVPVSVITAGPASAGTVCSCRACC